MKVSTLLVGLREARPPRRASHSCRVRLRDELVRPVRGDLEDVELRVQRIVGLRREAEAPAEDPVLDPDLLDLAHDGLAAGELAAAGVAPELDRPEDDLHRTVRR